MTDHQVIAVLCDLSARGIPACLARIVEARGSTPLGVGARMVFCGDGTTFGSIGGGCVEARVRTAAIRLLVQGGPPVLLDLDLSGADGEPDTDVCGGSMRVLLEVFEGRAGRPS